MKSGKIVKIEQNPEKWGNLRNQGKSEKSVKIPKILVRVLLGSIRPPAARKSFNTKGL